MEMEQIAMRVLDTEISGVKIIEPDVFGDCRGWFCETYNEARYREAGIDCSFVQDNESFSSKGVIRGLHWQAAEHAQAKLVRVVYGVVWDVAVDIRRGSPTFGKHVSVILSGANKRQFFIPRGFAHGFVVLENHTLFGYKCDNFYCPGSERGMRFNDPELGIKWPETGVSPNLSAKDSSLPLFAEIEPWKCE